MAKMNCIKDLKISKKNATLKSQFVCNSLYIFATVLHDLDSWQALSENITDFDILSRTGPWHIPKCYSILYNYAH